MTSKLPSQKLRGPVHQPPRPHNNCYWVIPNKLLAGEYPGAWQSDASRRRINAYLDAGVNFFVDLTEAGELPPYVSELQLEAQKRDITADHQRMSIVDMNIPESPAFMTGILDIIDSAIDAGRTVYVHCWGGIGRTGTVIGCYLVRHGNSGDEALGELARLWQNVEKRYYYPRSPQVDSQHDFVRNWSE